jgi:Uri superfamily endonuclease
MIPHNGTLEHGHSSSFSGTTDTLTVTSENHNTHLSGCKRPVVRRESKVNAQDDLSLPDGPGTYVLWVRLTGRMTVQVGKLGTITLPHGMYAYVGSARGPGGLRARLQRHLRPDKPIHWHIDAVTALVPVQAIWFESSPERLECRWARTLAALPDIATPFPGFGSSDCRCRSHFLAVPAGSMRQAWEALDRHAARPSAP